MQLGHFLPGTCISGYQISIHIKISKGTPDYNLRGGNGMKRELTGRSRTPDMPMVKELVSAMREHVLVSLSKEEQAVRGGSCSMPRRRSLSSR